MKIVIAPDSFKGSLTSIEAATQVERAILEVWPHAETVLIPMADGGEGTVDALLAAKAGEKLEIKVNDPLGRPISASYGWLGEEKTAIIETASASGLPLLAPDELDPYEASTYGTGELIAAALDQGAKKLIIGLGGSATIDAGTGCLQALGAEFYDSSGNKLKACGRSLGHIDQIDVRGIHPKLFDAEIVIASDVQNDLLGAEGAVHVFGPQKGVKAEQLNSFEQALQHYADVVVRTTGIDQKKAAGSGAAGGFGFTLLSFFRPRLVSGFELVAEFGNLEAHIREAGLVITGEGKLDAQSLYGKVPVGIANVSKMHGVPVIVMAGTTEGSLSTFADYGIHLAIPIVDDVMSLEEAMEKAADLIYKASLRVCKSFELAWLLTGRGYSI